MDEIRPAKAAGVAGAAACGEPIARSGAEGRMPALRGGRITTGAQANGEVWGHAPPGAHCPVKPE
jgi:hypothetical protein